MKTIQLPAIMCLHCLASYDKTPKQDGYPWCGCANPTLIRPMPVKGRYADREVVR